MKCLAMKSQLFWQFREAPISGLWPVVHEEAKKDRPSFLEVRGLKSQEKTFSVLVDRDSKHRTIEMVEPFKDGGFKLEVTKSGPVLVEGRSSNKDLLFLLAEDDRHYGGRRSRQSEQDDFPSGAEFWTSSEEDCAISLLASYYRSGMRRLKDGEEGTLWQKLFFQNYDLGYFIFQMKANTAIVLSRREGYLMYHWSGTALTLRYYNENDYYFFNFLNSMKKIEQLV